MMRSELDALVTQLVEGLTAAIPVVLYTVLLAFLALFLSAVVARLVGKVMRKPAVERLLERAEAEVWLSRLGARRSASELVPRILFWVLLLLFLRTGADALGLTAVSEAIGEIIGYLPLLLGAVVILLVGTVLAKVAGSAVTSAALGAGIEYSRVLGRLVTAAVLVVIAVMAADQLGIDTAMIQLTIGAILLALALGFSLAFGLGAREITRSILAGHYIRRTLKVGAEIRVGDVHGTLVGVTATHLLIENEGSVITVANRVMMDSIVQQ